MRWPYSSSDAQIHLAMLGFDLGDVGDPRGFRLQRERIALKPASYAWWRTTRIRTPPATLVPGPNLKASCCHQACNPVQAGTLVLLDHVFVHATSPQRAMAIFARTAWALSSQHSKRQLEPEQSLIRRGPTLAAAQRNKALGFTGEAPESTHMNYLA